MEIAPLEQDPKVRLFLASGASWRDPLGSAALDNLAPGTPQCSQGSSSEVGCVETVCYKTQLSSSAKHLVAASVPSKRHCSTSAKRFALKRLAKMGGSSCLHKQFQCKPLCANGGTPFETAHLQRRPL